MRFWNSWSNRSGRPEYWLSVTLLVLLNFASSYIFNKTEPGVGVTIIWQYVYSRRLHDIDRTAWWGIAILVLSLVPVALAFGFAGDEVGPLLLEQTNAATKTGWLWYYVATYGSAVVQFAFTAWLGFLRGDPCQNRFGYMPEPFRWPGRSKAEPSTKDGP